MLFYLIVLLCQTVPVSDPSEELQTDSLDIFDLAYLEYLDFNYENESTVAVILVVLLLIVYQLVLMYISNTDMARGINIVYYLCCPQYSMHVAFRTQCIVQSMSPSELMNVQNNPCHLQNSMCRTIPVALRTQRTEKSRSPSEQSMSPSELNVQNNRLGKAPKHVFISKGLLDIDSVLKVQPLPKLKL